MLKNGPSVCLRTAHIRGWYNSSILVEHLNFSPHAKPSNNNKVLLISDNHKGHCSAEVVTLPKEMASFSWLYLHIHTCHKLQLLDWSVLRPYKTYYNAACKDWMTTHPGTPTTLLWLNSVAKLTLCHSNQYRLHSRPRVVIWPLNQNIFQHHDLQSSAVTDRPDPTQCTARKAKWTQQPSTSVEDNDHARQVPSTGHPSYVSPEDGHPFPQTPHRIASNWGHKRGICQIQADGLGEELEPIPAITDMN